MLKLAMNKKMVIATLSATALVVISAVSVAVVTGMQRNTPDSMTEPSSTDVIVVSGENVNLINEYDTTTAQGASTEAVGTTTSSTAVSAKETLNTTKSTKAATLAGKKEFPLSVSSKSDSISSTTQNNSTSVLPDGGVMYQRGNLTIVEYSMVSQISQPTTPKLNGDK